MFLYLTEEFSSDFPYLSSGTHIERGGGWGGAAYPTLAPNFGGFEVCHLSGVWNFEMVSRF